MPTVGRQNTNKQRRRLGLCVRCGSDKLETETLCARHSEAQRTASVRHYARERRDAGKGYTPAGSRRVPRVVVRLPEGTRGRESGGQG